jgi:hypothetical protein
MIRSFLFRQIKGSSKIIERKKMIFFQKLFTTKRAPTKNAMAIWSV